MSLKCSRCAHTHTHTGPHTWSLIIHGNTCRGNPGLKCIWWWRDWRMLLPDALSLFLLFLSHTTLLLSHWLTQPPSFLRTHTHTYTPNVKMTSVAALSSCLTLNREVAVLLSLSLVRDYHIYKLPVPCAPYVSGRGGQGAHRCIICVCRQGSHLHV